MAGCFVGLALATTEAGEAGETHDVENLAYIED